MRQTDIISYFDQASATWDQELVHDDQKINTILDYAQIHDNVRVLDVACGTGVLFPDYLARNVAQITGVDISSGMIAKAREKFQDPRIELLCADVQFLSFDTPFDCCMVYNAVPHFQFPSLLLGCLAKDLRDGGRLTIAHGMSRRQLDQHHSGSAHAVSVGLMPEDELRRLMAPLFEVDVMVSNEQMYVVSGFKK